MKKIDSKKFSYYLSFCGTQTKICKTRLHEFVRSRLKRVLDVDCGCGEVRDIYSLSLSLSLNERRPFPAQGSAYVRMPSHIISYAFPRRQA